MERKQEYPPATGSRKPDTRRAQGGRRHPKRPPAGYVSLTMHLYGPAKVRP